MATYEINTYNIYMIMYISAFVVLIVTLISHIIGMNGLYFHFPAYDIFMHIIGGIGIGLFLTAFIKSNLPNLRCKRSVLIVGVFIVGLVWELFEMYFNIAGAPVGTKAYYIDTIKDLTNDIIGATIVAVLFIKKSK